MSQARPLAGCAVTLRPLDRSCGGDRHDVISCRGRDNGAPSSAAVASGGGGSYGRDEQGLIFDANAGSETSSLTTFRDCRQRRTRGTISGSSWHLSKRISERRGQEVSERWGRSGKGIGRWAWGALLSLL